MKRMTRMGALALVAAGALAGPVAAASAASSPSVTATSPTHVAQTSARLNGTVNPNGATTTYVFQYGLTNTYGLNTRGVKVGNGTKFVAVSAPITGLIPGTPYHYRIVAINSHGTAVGRDHTVTTVGPPPPDAATGPASNVGVNAATISGVINPNGAVTGYAFQYGTTTAYGSGAVPYPPGQVSGKTPVSVSETLSGLTPDQLFHYRLVAYHQVGPPSYGADGVFMTEPTTKFKPAVHASTTPHRVRHSPFAFTTSGSVAGPSSIASAFDCNGYVGVHFYYGRRAVAFELLPVSPTCTFSGVTTLTHKPGKGPRKRTVRLKVVVYFRGNGYLKPGFARDQTVTVG